MRIYLIIFTVMLCSSLSAQVEKRVTGTDLHIDSLREGTRRYLVHMEKSEGAILDMSIWERTVAFKEAAGKRFIEVSQVWKNQDANKVKKLYSLQDNTTFLPIYHQVISGQNKVEAYSFSPQRIVGADSIDNNLKADFELELASPTFNFELDIELLRMLPFEENTTFLVPFYHPGSKTLPKGYKYKVLGKEKITGPLGEVQCWKLLIKYSLKNQAIFWISATSRELIKMEETYGPIKRYKMLMW